LWGDGEWGPQGLGQIWLGATRSRQGLARFCDLGPNGSHLLSAMVIGHKLRPGVCCHPLQGPMMVGQWW